MGTITHKAGRVAVGKAADVVIKNLDKDREKEILKLVDFMEKYMDGEKLDVDFDSVRKKIKDKDSALNKYINKALDEIDPGVLKTMVLNLGFEAFLNGTKTIRKREKSITVMFLGSFLWILQVPATFIVQAAGRQNMATGLILHLTKWTVL